MKKYLARIACLLVAALQTVVLSGQGLPRMKQADEITRGTFPNGIEYYFINNPVAKGRASFALVQENDRPVSEIRHALNGAGNMDPADFLNRRGVPYYKSGFVSYAYGARVFTFSEVDIHTSDVRDSTILMLTELMRLSDKSQALIVSGDIDKSQMLTKFGAMALTIPKVEATGFSGSKSGASGVFLDSSVPGRITVSMGVGSFTREQEGTPMPLVSELFAKEFEVILMERIRAEFQFYEIPNQISDEGGYVDVLVDVYDTEIAADLIRAIIADMRYNGVSDAEFASAKKIALPSVVTTGLKLGKSNEFYVTRCVNSVITGGHLASEKTIRNFFLKRQISTARERKLFDDFVSAAIGDTFPQDDNFEQTKVEFPVLPAPLKFHGRAQAKLANSITDPVTGGKLWTFSNGIKVIYKYLPNEDGFDYCVSLRGGISSVEGIGEDEAAALSSLLRYARIGGVDGHRFHKVLREMDINMEERVGLHDVRILGSAPSGELKSVLSAIHTISYDREVDSVAVDWYRLCLEAVNPDAVEDMSPDFPSRAEALYERHFSNFSDGVFIFIGNIKEQELMDVLTRALPSFRTSRIYASRRRLKYQPDGSRVVRYVEGADRRISFSSATGHPLNLESYLTSQLAKEVLSYYYAHKLHSLGMYSSVEIGALVSPVEMFTLDITFRPCLQDGLPEGVTQPTTDEALRLTRQLFLQSQFCDLTKEEFKNCKDVVKARLSNELQTMGGMMKYALYRYSDGKDLTSGYAAALDKIEIDDVRWLLEELTSYGVEVTVVR